MNVNIKIFLIGILSSICVLGIILGFFYIWNPNNQVDVFGATILPTGATNTINVFRTNVNTSLENINNELATIGAGAFNSNVPYVYLATSTNILGIGATTTDIKLYVQGTAVASTTVYFQGMAAQTADIFRVASSSGNNYLTISTTGTITAVTGFEFTNATGTSARITTISVTNVSATQISASGYLQGATLDISGQSSLAAVSGTNISVTGYGTFPTLNFTSASGTTITSTNLTVSQVLRIPFDQLISSTGSIKISITTDTLNYYANGVERSINPEQCITKVIENPASSTEDDAFWIAGATSTITRFESVNKTAGDQIYFNVVWTSTRATASATANHLFSVSVTSTRTTSTDRFPFLVSFASSVVNTGDIVRWITGGISGSNYMSSTQWTSSLCWRQNP